MFDPPKFYRDHLKLQHFSRSVFNRKIFDNYNIDLVKDLMIFWFFILVLSFMRPQLSGLSPTQSTELDVRKSFPEACCTEVDLQNISSKSL